MQVTIRLEPQNRVLSMRVDENASVLQFAELLLKKLPKDAKLNHKYYLLHRGCVVQPSKEVSVGDLLGKTRTLVVVDEAYQARKERVVSLPFDLVFV